MRESRRAFLKIAYAAGTAVTAIGSFELGRRVAYEAFRQEFEKQMDQIYELEQAKQALANHLNEKEEEIKGLISEKEQLQTCVDQLSSDYGRAQNIIRLSDLLETETSETLSLYKTKEHQAIDRLKELVAKYIPLLGGDRVKAEKAMAEVLTLALNQRIALEQDVSKKQRELERLQEEINKLSNSWWSEVPLNPNGDFSEGMEYWGAGSGGELRNARWGYKIVPNEYGEIWLSNPNIDNWPNAALYQGTFGWRSPQTTWYLKDKHFVLEADAQVVEDIPYDQKGWSRVAIVIMISRIDGRDYNIRGKITRYLYTEYDIYRRNFPWDGYRDWKDSPTDVYEYHADQLPFGYWKPYKIDVTEFLQNGYNGIGGWGSEIYEVSRINAWYLVVENTAAKTTARLRKVKIYQV